MMTRTPLALACSGALLLAVAAITAQQPPAVRRSTNLSALLAFPAYFHQRGVLVIGELKRRGKAVC